MDLALRLGHFLVQLPRIAVLSQLIDCGGSDGFAP
jgi:hypothetical protein